MNETERELFHRTSAEYDYWYATYDGIHATFVIGAYQNMDVETATEVRDELTAIIDDVGETIDEVS